MKISLIFVGKTTDSAVDHGVEKYLKRMKRYIPFQIDIIPALKNTRNMSEAEIKIKEGESIINRLGPSDFLVLLDEKGIEMTSFQFASFIEKSMHLSIKNLVFVVGGAYGFSEKVYQKAQRKISLSQMTFSHQIIRMIFLEQIYRAFTIIKNEPYHHE